MQFRAKVLAAIAAVMIAGAAHASPADDQFALGASALKAGDIVAAMTAFSAALDADPAHAASAYERGRLFLTIGEPKLALADFTVAILADGGNGRAYARRGEAKMVLKDAAGAFADFDKAVSTSPADPEVLVIRATYFLKTGDLTRARMDLVTARDLADAADAKAIQVLIDRLD